MSGDCVNGFGKCRWDDGAEYEGQWQNDQQTGKGTAIYPDGDMYKGDWSDSKWHGKGTLNYDDGGKYEGDFRDDTQHGTGTNICPVLATYHAVECWYVNDGIIDIRTDHGSDPGVGFSLILYDLTAIISALCSFKILI